MGEHRAGLLQQRDAGGGRLDPARQAAQQQGAELLLQAMHEAAEGRLGHAQALGGPGDMACLGDGDERLQAAKFDHAIPHGY